MVGGDSCLNENFTSVVLREAPACCNLLYSHDVSLKGMSVLPRCILACQTKCILEIPKGLNGLTFNDGVGWSADTGNVPGLEASAAG